MENQVREHSQWHSFLEDLRSAVKHYATANGVQAGDVDEMVITPRQQRADKPASISFAMNTNTKVERQFFDRFACALAGQTLSVASERSPSGRRSRITLSGSPEQGMGLRKLLDIMQEAGWYHGRLIIRLS